MKHIPTITGFRFKMKTGHSLTFVANEPGSVFQISTESPNRKHNPGITRSIYLKRNTAAILASTLMHELKCTTIHELNAMIDYETIITP
jgi:hypothetical protein